MTPGGTKEPGKRSASGGGRTRLRRELVEGEILEQAAELFARRGAAGTTLQDLADALGVSRPLLYYYIKNKDELLARMVSEVTEGIAGALAAAAGRTDLGPDDRLREMARVMVSQVAARPLHFRVLDRSEDDLPPPIAEVQAQAKRAVLDMVRAVIEEGIEAGVFRPVDPRVGALGVIGLCNWTAWWFHPGPEHPVAPGGPGARRHGGGFAAAAASPSAAGHGARGGDRLAA